MTDSYEIFKADILRLTGIDLNAYKENQMKRRIDSLIGKYRLLTYKQYVETLKKEKAVFDEFINYLTINVSEFYRDPALWKVLEEDVLPQILQRNPMPRVWSAACSTGDEPYSLVMLLAKFLPLSKIRITATDIDRQVLDKARLGLYGAKSLKGLPDEYKRKYLKKVNEETFRIDDAVKRCVDFRQHNLLKDPYPDRYDLIVCRNVLIYFTEEAKDEICRKFHTALKPEGFLFIGNSERIDRPEKMGYHMHQLFFYQKK